MPRKPNPKCPPELQARLDVINQPPTATSNEWKDFTNLLVEIVGELENRRANQEFTSRFEDAFEMEKQMVVEYRDLVRARVSDQFRSFALCLDEISFSSSKEMRQQIGWVRRERMSVRDMIRTSQDNDGGGWIMVTMQRLIGLENGFLKDLDHFHAIDYIIEHRIPINRLNICSICDKVYWQKYSGKVRRSETCGNYECGYRLANLKRKAPPEKRFRFVKKEKI